MDSIYLMDSITKNKLISAYDNLDDDERETISSIIAKLKYLRDSLMKGELSYSTFCDEREFYITILSDYLV